MKSRHRSAWYALACVTALQFTTPVVAHGPAGHTTSAPSSVPGAPGRLADGSVLVPKQSQRRMEIRTAIAKLSEAAATLELPARVVPDPNASGRVQAAHGGRIEPGPRGLPVSGQVVRRGDVLGYVRHHAEPYALGNQQSQLAQVRAARQTAEQRLRRFADLEGTVPRREIEAAHTQAQALAEQERSIVASLAMREALIAPVSGVIARSDVALGQVVEARDVLFEVIDPGRMLVEATTVDPNLAARIVAATLPAAPEATLRLLGMARMLRDGVLPISFVVSAKPGGTLPLVIGQSASVVVSLRERVAGVVLPAQAVVRSPANEFVVWTKSGAERFAAQAVQFRTLDAGTVIVTRGLDADSRVVVQGASLIAQIR